MEMTTVKSSNIHSIGYEDGTLKVRFHSDAEYEYTDVSKSDHADFIDAESKGRWLNAFVAQRSGVTQTKKPPSKPKTPPVTKQSNDAAKFAGSLMRSQMKEPGRTTFRLPNR